MDVAQQIMDRLGPRSAALLPGDAGPQAEPVPDEAAEKAKEQERNEALQLAWMKRIRAEQECRKTSRARMREVQEVARPPVKKEGHDVIVPLYWQIISVEHGGVYSNQPVPDCRPRNDEQNELFRQAADILERAIAYCVDDRSYDEALHRAIDDFLAVGLGVCRIKMDAKVIGNEVGDQMLRWEYVPHQRFGWEPSNSWRACNWIYFRHAMTRAQIKERFGRDVASTREESDRQKHTQGKAYETFDIYEVWDRKARKVLFLSKGEKTPLEVNEDPLGLKDFYPCPRPMMTNLLDEEMEPKPDYDYIEAFDQEINRLQERRTIVLESLRVTGAYDDGLPELADMMKLDDNQYQPVKQLMQRVKATGVDGLLLHLPMNEKMTVITELTEQIQVLRAQVDEIMGIADIVRGVTQATETAAAQDIKGRWVGVRLSRKRDEVQYTIRETFRIMGQLFSTHFTPENLQRLTQVQADPQTIALLKNDLLMDFAIDIESESTVAKDEFKERATRQEMLNSVGAFSTAVMPLVQANQMPASVVTAMLQAALQPYARYSRTLDEAIAQLPTSQQQLQQVSQQLQQSQMQLQQSQQQLQQWQQVAQTLQANATAAKSQRESAEARKKDMEARQIAAEMDPGSQDNLATVERVAEIDLTRATAEQRRAQADKTRQGGD